jgi:hypothetical protein
VQLRFGDVDWARTIRAHLRHYQPQQRTIVPEQLVGFARRTRTLVDLDEVELSSRPIGLDGDERRLQLDRRRRHGVAARPRHEARLLRAV